VLQLTLNRPSKKNALTLAMYTELDQQIKAAENNPEINAVIIHGEGDAFCAGNDINDFVAAVNNPDALKCIVGFLHTLASFPKPIIAAVHGDAVGIGTTMMLHCDCVIAAENLKCATPFVKLGLVPEGGSSLLMPQLIGHRHAFELLVEGKPFTAQQALTAGLINKIVENNQLLPETIKRAETIAALPAEATLASKALLKNQYLKQLHQVMDEEGELFYQRLSSNEARQAFMNFLQKANSRNL
jgi:enoyl-CoA hydratase/carnithine racemase